MAQSDHRGAAPGWGDEAGSIASFVRAGTTILQLAPAHIWAMSPREIHFLVTLKLGVQPQRPRRSDLDYLFSLDQPRQAKRTQHDR